MKTPIQRLLWNKRWRESAKGRRYFKRKWQSKERKTWQAEYDKRPKSQRLRRLRVKRARAKYSKEMRRFLDAYKLKKGCFRCGYRKHPGALAFHHRNPKQKKFTIAEAIKRMIARVRVLLEIKKCKVLCANCHCILHYEERK